jgi:hypothetical protein
MLLDTDEIDAVCRNDAGVEAWILEDSELVHFGKRNLEIGHGC